jgi:hypothetical protein
LDLRVGVGAPGDPILVRGEAKSPGAAYNSGNPSFLNAVITGIAGEIDAQISSFSGQAYAAGTSSTRGGTLSFANAGNVSFGLNGSTITATATVPASVQFYAAGTTSGSGGTLSFSNANGFTFGLNGSTITLSASLTAAAPVLSFYQNMQAAQFASFTTPQVSTAINLSLQRFSVPWNMTATLLEMPGALSVLGSASAEYSLSVAVYTLAGLSASRMSSAQATASFASGSNSTLSSVYGAWTNTQWRSVAIGSWNFTPGEYMFAFMMSATGSSAIAFSWHGMSSLSVRGFMGGERSFYWANGVYTSATGAFPDVLQLSQLIQTGSTPNRQVFFQMHGTY